MNLRTVHCCYSHHDDEGVTISVTLCMSPCRSDCLILNPR